MGKRVKPSFLHVVYLIEHNKQTVNHFPIDLFAECIFQAVKPGTFKSAVKRKNSRYLNINYANINYYNMDY